MDTTRVEILSEPFEKLANQIVNEYNHNNSSIWDTLLLVLAGGLISIITQIVIEWFKNWNLKDKKKRELSSRARAKVYFIGQILKDLAMYKTHKQYYIGSVEIAKDEKEKEDSFNKHYQKGQEQRQTEERLDENIAEFFQIVAEFPFSKEKKKQVQGWLQKVYEYEHPKPEKFIDCKTEEELTKKLGKEESRLNKEYMKFHKIFIEIQSFLS